MKNPEIEEGSRMETFETIAEKACIAGQLIFLRVLARKGQTWEILRGSRYESSVEEVKAKYGVWIDQDQFDTAKFIWAACADGLKICMK